jgi:RluA family pseudouridine synthase
MATITNISTYRFTPMRGLKELREELIRDCRSWNLKGTILLSEEGINLFVAGAAEDIDRLMAKLRALPGLESLEPKVSLSDHQPFNRMLVRIKKEIISFGVEGVNPARHTSPKLAPRELKRWLDEGRPVTLLDTRNDYEVRVGTFRNAVVPHINTFREFPAAVDQLPDELKEQPIVMFCTGGIRCEKAGPMMELKGFKNVHQLDGGILKYFEECGGAHYDGECFVFDQRVGVDPALNESEYAVCFACQAPLTAEEQEDPRYVVGKSCPHCHKSEPEKMAARMAARAANLLEICDPLPGSTPRECRRPVRIPASHDRMLLIDALDNLLPQVGVEEWRKRISEGRLVNYAGEPRGAEHIVRAGERVLHVSPPVVEPDVSSEVRWLHEDEVFLAVNKPAPLPVHACGRFERNTLLNFLTLTYAPYVPRVLHRLDANTTGVCVFARTRHWCRIVMPQFAEGRVEKTYLARIQGHPLVNDFACTAPISTEPGRHGGRMVDEANGQPAETRFRVLSREADGTALVEARPITGRTNQIRVHLWHLGMPIVGDPLYLTDGGDGECQTLPVGAVPMMLHALRMELDHPLKGGRIAFEAPRPVWATAQGAG